VRKSLGLGLLLVVTGCQQDGFWTRKRAIPESLQNHETRIAAAPETTSSFSRPEGKYGDFQQIFADVAEAALPAVVSIRNEHETGFDATDEGGLGSGVLIDSSGIILTNNHVIEGAARVRVQLYDDREFDAEILGADQPTDLAVIRIKNAKGTFTAMPLGDSEKLRIGEWVLAVGSPYGLSQTVTTGIISAKGRHNTGINSYENFLQTDAAINPGNSGGALLNLHGELVGINTAIFSRSGGYQGIGFAIPISMARKISADLIRDGAVTRGWLGVSIQSVEAVENEGNTNHRGALVSGVIPGGPAEKAGIQRGDIITRIASKSIVNANDLLNTIALQNPGSWIDVELNRGSKRLVLKAELTRRDENQTAKMRKR